MHSTAVRATVPGCGETVSKRVTAESKAACNSDQDFSVFRKATQNVNLLQFLQEHDCARTNLSEYSLGRL